MWKRRGIDNRRMTDGRVSSRAVGVHEGAEEILALADNSGARPARQSHCPYAGLCRGAVYLYIVLGIVWRRAERTINANL